MNLFDKLGELMQKTPEELSAMAKKQNEKLGLNGSFAFCISLTVSYTHLTLPTTLVV